MHRLDVLGAAHERQGHHVNAIAERPAQVLGVLLTHRRDAHGDAWQIDSLVVADRSADHYLGDHVGARDLGRPEGDPAVVDQDQVTGPDISAQTLVRRGTPLDRSLDVLHRDSERRADKQLFLATGKTAEPDLRALKVGEHPNRASGGLRRLADAAQVSFMIGIVAMTHVESGDIHSCGNQLRQALGA